MKKLIYLTFLLIIVGSCTDDTLLSTEQIKLATLKFNGSDSMLKYFDSMIRQRANPTGRTNSQPDNGFESFNTVYLNAIGNVTKQKIKGGSDFWSSLPTRNIFIQSNGIGHLTDTLASPSW